MFTFQFFIEQNIKWFWFSELKMMKENTYFNYNLKCLQVLVLF